MLAGVVGVLLFLSLHTFPGFLAMFLVLFVTAGIGNGSTYRMIPAIFWTERMHAAAGRGPDAEALADREGRREAATVLGFAGAVGAYGGFFVPQSYSLSISASGGVGPALIGFALFYLTCMLLTWWYYLRLSDNPSRLAATALARARV